MAMTSAIERPVERIGVEIDDLTLRSVRDFFASRSAIEQLDVFPVRERIDVSFNTFVRIARAADRSNVLDAVDPNSVPSAAFRLTTGRDSGIDLSQLEKLQRFLLLPAILFVFPDVYPETEDYKEGNAARLVFERSSALKAISIEQEKLDAMRKSFFGEMFGQHVITRSEIFFRQEGKTSGEFAPITPIGTEFFDSIERNVEGVQNDAGVYRFEKRRTSLLFGRQTIAKVTFRANLSSGLPEVGTLIEARVLETIKLTKVPFAPLILVLDRPLVSFDNGRRETLQEKIKNLSIIKNPPQPPSTSIVEKEEQDDESIACDVCGTGSDELFVCTECNNAVYCGAECQAIDWRHREHFIHCAAAAHEFHRLLSIGKLVEGDFSGSVGGFLLSERARELIEVPGEKNFALDFQFFLRFAELSGVDLQARLEGNAKVDPGVLFVFPHTLPQNENYAEQNRQLLAVQRDLFPTSLTESEVDATKRVNRVKEVYRRHVLLRRDMRVFRLPKKVSRSSFERPLIDDDTRQGAYLQFLLSEVDRDIDVIGPDAEGRSARYTFEKSRRLPFVERRIVAVTYSEPLPRPTTSVRAEVLAQIELPNVPYAPLILVVDRPFVVVTNQ